MVFHEMSSLLLFSINDTVVLFFSSERRVEGLLTVRAPVLVVSGVWWGTILSWSRSTTRPGPVSRSRGGSAGRWSQECPADQVRLVFPVSSSSVQPRPRPEPRHHHHHHHHHQLDLIQWDLSRHWQRQRDQRTFPMLHQIYKMLSKK